MLRSFLFSLVLLSTTSIAAGAALGRQYEWVVQQEGPDWGKQTIYASARGVRIENHRYDFDVMILAPDWKAYCYRPGDKVIWSGQHMDMRKLISFGGMLNPGNPSAFTKTGRQSYLGLACDRYYEPIARAYTLGNPVIKLPGREIQFVCDYYSIPHFPEFPVANYFHSPSARKYTTTAWLQLAKNDWSTASTFKIETTSCKRIPFKPQDFAVPVGYKIAETPDYMLLSSNGQDEIIEMIEGVGFAPLGHDKKGGEKAKQSAGKPR